MKAFFCSSLQVSSCRVHVHPTSDTKVAYWVVATDPVLQLLVAIPVDSCVRSSLTPTTTKKITQIQFIYKYNFNTYLTLTQISYSIQEATCLKKTEFLWSWLYIACISSTVCWSEYYLQCVEAEKAQAVNYTGGVSQHYTTMPMSYNVMKLKNVEVVLFVCSITIRLEQNQLSWSWNIPYSFFEYFWISKNSLDILFFWFADLKITYNLTKTCFFHGERGNFMFLLPKQIQLSANLKKLSLHDL